MDIKKINTKKLVMIIIGVVLIAFGVGIYSLKVNEQHKYIGFGSGGIININSRDGIVRIGGNGIEVRDGEDNVSIGWNGIHINDGGDQVSIGWNGIHINEGNKSYFNINPGKWFNFGSSNMVSTTIDNEKFAEIHGIDNITISSSFVDIKVTAEDREDVRVKYHGKMKSNVIPELEIEKKANSLNIKLETRNSNSYTIASSDVVLEVFVPKSYNKTFNLSNSSGNIYINSLDGDSIHTSTSSGDVKLEDIKANLLKLSTSSGSIKLEDPIGEIQASTSSGSVSLDIEENNKDIKVSTSSGSVNIKLPDNASYKIKGSSSSGRYTPSKNMIVTENKKGIFQATIGSGKNSIEVSTSSGNVKFSE